MVEEGIKIDRASQMQERLEPVADGYSSADRLTPDLVNETWEKFWEVLGDESGHKFEGIPVCDISEDELELLKVEGRHVVLVPDEIMTPEGLIALGRAIPLNSGKNGILWPEDAIKDIKNEDSRGGVIDIEMDDSRPNSSKTEEEARKLLDEYGILGMRLATFIVGSLFNRFIMEDGKYFDSSFTTSRLLGSTFKDRPLSVTSGPDGTIVIIPHMDSSIAASHLGFRTEGIL